MPAADPPTARPQLGSAAQAPVRWTGRVAPRSRLAAPSNPAAGRSDALRTSKKKVAAWGE
eukprot:scaffold7369_cov61-Phaeocystis_antarctica.AAC.8